MNKALYTRPNKPASLIARRRKEVPIRALPRLPEVVEVDRFSECHVTPHAAAVRMVQYLGPAGDYLTLEPSAGTGNLINALYECGHSPCELTAIEKNHALCNEICRRFKGDLHIDPIQQCFLEYAENAAGKIEFPRVIMNPPFRAVKKHISAALKLLGRGGHDCATLVALVPITFEHKHAELMEKLDRETFHTASVSTKIIRFEFY